MSSRENFPRLEPSQTYVQGMEAREGLVCSGPPASPLARMAPGYGSQRDRAGRGGVQVISDDNIKGFVDVSTQGWHDEREPYFFWLPVSLGEPPLALLSRPICSSLLFRRKKFSSIFLLSCTEQPF